MVNWLFLSNLFSGTKSESDKDLIRYLKKYFGFTPFHLQLFKQALIHKSVTKSRKEGVRHSNERLEFLGDAVLDAIIGDYLYRKYPDENEGFLTKARSKIVSRSSLTSLAKTTGLHHIIISDITDENVRLNLAGNAFEALIGAMYLQKGYPFTCSKTIKILDRFINIDELVENDTDFKSQVYEWAQKNRKETSFKTTAINNQSLFEASLYLDDELIGVGTGSNKKSAEQEASKIALKKLVG